MLAALGIISRPQLYESFKKITIPHLLNATTINPGIVIYPPASAPSDFEFHTLVLLTRTHHSTDLLLNSHHVDIGGSG